MNKRIICCAIFVSIALLLISACEREPILSQDFGEKNIVLEKSSIELDPLQEEEFFVGVNNKDIIKASFSFFVSCETPNCEQHIVAQFFPTVVVEAQKKIAVPFLITATENAVAGEYRLKISVQKDAAVIGEEIVTVTVLNTVAEKKKLLS